MITFKEVSIKFVTSLKLPLIFIFMLWCIFLSNLILFGGSLNQYGVQPRVFSGIYGILFSPFLHGNFAHIIGNSIFFLLLSWIICFNSVQLWYKTLVFGTILGGLFTWIFGLGGVHIGASGVVFALWGTIIGMAINRKNPYYIIASIVLVLGYGMSFIWGLIPQDGISWAGHFGGLLSGLACSKQVKYNNKY